MGKVKTHSRLASMRAILGTALLCAVLGAGPAPCALAQGTDSGKSDAGTTAAPGPRKGQKPRAARPGAPVPPQKGALKSAQKRGKDARSTRPAAKEGRDQKPALSAEELLTPYSAMGGEQQNASRWQLDPAPQKRPFAVPQDDSGVNFKVGPDRRVDPLTGKEVKTPTDVAGAKQSVKEMDLKGAMDKLGGKAEVQVEILKF